MFENCWRFTGLAARCECSWIRKHVTQGGREDNYVVKHGDIFYPKWLIVPGRMRRGVGRIGLRAGAGNRVSGNQPSSLRI